MPSIPGIDVVHVDAGLIVLCKPSGLLSVPGRGDDKQDCLSTRVQRHCPDALVVHRLDMATSGLMLMARGIVAQRVLSGAFEQREVHKRYLAVAHGHIDAAVDSEGWGVIDLPIAVDWPRRPLRIIDAASGKPSRTRWRALGHDAVADSTRLELEPVTGRSHQLRVHLQAIGHPLLGDALYAPEAVRLQSPRLLLHASRLTLRHPLSFEPLTFDSAPDF